MSKQNLVATQFFSAKQSPIHIDVSFYLYRSYIRMFWQIKKKKILTNQERESAKSTRQYVIDNFAIYNGIHVIQIQINMARKVPECAE